MRQINNENCEVCSFIGLYILHKNIMYWKHTWHMDKCVNRWSTNLWMNECHVNFTSFYKSICQMCFQSTISMCETYKLWMNKFCTISIIKTWDAKFVIQPNYFIYFLITTFFPTTFPTNYLLFLWLFHSFSLPTNMDMKRQNNMCLCMPMILFKLNLTLA
jgi:hypothetical protein